MIILKQIKWVRLTIWFSVNNRNEQIMTLVEEKTIQKGCMHENDV